MLLNSSEWAHRSRYAGIHALLSLGVVGLIAALMFFLWYPEPYRALSGGLHLFLILVLVDVTLGPCATLVQIGVRFQLSRESACRRKHPRLRPRQTTHV